MQSITKILDCYKGIIEIKQIRKQPGGNTKSQED